MQKGWDTWIYTHWRVEEIDTLPISSIYFTVAVADGAAHCAIVALHAPLSPRQCRLYPWPVFFSSSATRHTKPTIPPPQAFSRLLAWVGLTPRQTLNNHSLQTFLNPRSSLKSQYVNLFKVFNCHPRVYRGLISQECEKTAMSGSRAGPQPDKTVCMWTAEPRTCADSALRTSHF